MNSATGSPGSATGARTSPPPFTNLPGQQFPRGLVLIATSAESYADTVAGWLADRRRQLARQLGRPPVTALSGGNTPRPVYRRLGEAAQSDPTVLAGTWIQVDERDVLPSHPDSNQGLISTTLLAHRGPDTAWLPFAGAGEGNPHRVVATYEAHLRELRAGQDAPADLAWLGLGEDGHTASLFPGASLGFEGQNQAWVASYEAPHGKGRRYTLTFAALVAIPALVFLVTGSGKADLLARLLAGRADDLPAGALTARRPAIWLLDPPAARAL